MHDGVKVDSMNFEVEDIRYVKAEDDFSKGSSHYDSTVYGKLHLFINGEEVSHKNKLPAVFDLVDTARAHHEVIAELNKNGSYSGKPFCCTCGDRGCAYINWDVKIVEDEIELVMENLLGEPIGDHSYIAPITVFRDALLGLFDELINFMDANGLQIFEWAEWMETPKVNREHYATLEKIQEYRDSVESFRDQ